MRDANLSEAPPAGNGKAADPDAMLLRQVRRAAATAEAWAVEGERDSAKRADQLAGAIWVFQNARLLVAAPELLAACKAWVSYFDKLDRDAEPGDPLAEARRHFHSARVEATRAAIRKAETGGAA